MTIIQIYEPAMCCSTGLCGPSIDPDLLRMSFIMNNIKNSDVKVLRFNLTSDTDAFVENTALTTLLSSEGMSVLPSTYVDGELVVKGHYPTTAQFSEWTGLTEGDLVKKPRIRLSVKGDA